MAAQRLFERGVTGILCGSDVIALGVIRAARQAGLRVPDELSVVGQRRQPAGGVHRSSAHHDPAAGRGPGRGRLPRAGRPDHRRRGARRRGALPTRAGGARLDGPGPDRGRGRAPCHAGPTDASTAERGAALSEPTATRRAPAPRRDQRRGPAGARCAFRACCTGGPTSATWTADDAAGAGARRRHALRRLGRDEPGRGGRAAAALGRLDRPTRVCSGAAPGGRGRWPSTRSPTTCRTGDGATGRCGSGAWAPTAPEALAVTTELEVLPSGLVRLRAAVRNTGDATYEVAHLEPALPVPAEAAELLDMAGRHTHERTPQRRPFDLGQWVREAWGGRPGHDAATVMCAGHPGFAFRTGRVWGVHLAWSGNQVLSAEHSVHRLAAAARRRAAAARRGPARPRRGVRVAVAGRVLGRGARRAVGPLPPTPAVPARTPPRSPQGAAQHLGGGALRPRPRHAGRAGRAGRRHRHRAVRARRRLVPAPTGRPRGARGLVRRREGVAGRAPSAGGPRARPRHGLRAVVRARDGQPRLGPRPRTPGLALRDRPRPGHRVASPARPRPRSPGGVRPRPRADVRAGDGVPHRVHQVGPQPRAGRRRAPARRATGRARPDRGGLPAHGRAAGPASRARDRVVLRRGRSGRPRRPRARRPGVGLRLHRRARAPADGAVDGADAAARADGHPRGVEPGPHHRPRRTTWTSAPAPRSGATSGSSGT